MPKDKYMVVGVFVKDRQKNAPKLQEALTNYGCNIKTRIGLHDACDDVCSPNGLVLLELVGHMNKVLELMEKLKRAVGDTNVQMMMFDK